MATADSLTSANAMLKHIEEHRDKCIENHSAWAGYTDIENEGVFVNVVTKEEMVWKNWKKNNPTGSRDDNCVTISGEGTMWERACHYKICTMCRLTKKSRHLSLRGSCPEEKLDLKYLITKKMEEGRYVIRGLRFTDLVWNQNASSWNFVNIRNKMLI